MRLIDADALCDYLDNESHTILDEEHLYGTGLFDREIADAIQKQKTVDAVPVVRCRECKNYIQRGTKKVGACDILCCAVDDDFFCADGKRKEKTDEC